MAIVKNRPPGSRFAGRLKMPHRFGSHLSVAGGMRNAVTEALRLGFDTVQVFVKNQRQWNAPPLRTEDVDLWLSALAAPNFGPPIAHATYLINLASPDPMLFARSRDAFAEELLRCQTLGIPYLVVHPGAAMGAPAEEAVQRVAAALNQIFDRHPQLQTMPLLETTAGQGSTLGRTFRELGEIIRQIQEPRRIGVCVDTCHVFAAGYDIPTLAGYQAMMAEAAQSVGLERIRCWHFNDSKGECGSRLDRHEHIGRGRIGNTGFQNVLSDPRFHGVPIILETPKGENTAGRNWDRVNLARLKKLFHAKAQKHQDKTRSGCLGTKVSSRRLGLQQRFVRRQR